MILIFEDWSIKMPQDSSNFKSMVTTASNFGRNFLSQSRYRAKLGFMLISIQ